jgi:hypothetical protein
MPTLPIHKKHQRPEHFLQVRIANYLRSKDIFFFAVPNGGKRDEEVGFNLKLEGVLAGVSDLVIIHEGKVYFVEIKNGTKGVQSPTQKAFQARVEEQGFSYLIWRFYEDAIEFIKGLKI